MGLKALVVLSNVVSPVRNLLGQSLTSIPGDTNKPVGKTRNDCYLQLIYNSTPLLSRRFAHGRPVSVVGIAEGGVSLRFMACLGCILVVGYWHLCFPLRIDRAGG